MQNDVYARAMGAHPSIDAWVMSTSQRCTRERPLVRDDHFDRALGSPKCATNARCAAMADSFEVANWLGRYPVAIDAMRMLVPSTEKSMRQSLRAKRKPPSRGRMRRYGCGSWPRARIRLTGGARS